jgi:N-acyl-phosphatidylethanolamine-hydrolysing phospholipase D
VAIRTAASKAHHRPPEGFRNPWPDAQPRPFTDLLRWRRERTRHPPPPNPHPSRLPTATPEIVARAPATECRATWVGHATVLLQLGALNVLTDPMWSMRASPLSFLGPRRIVPPAVALETLPTIDVVLLSHNHYDHLDRRTVEKLTRVQPQARWLAPLGLGEVLRKWGVVHAEEHDWDEEIGLDTPGGHARFGCTPAQHFSARGLRDRNATLWCGWTIAIGDWRVFFAGDTGLHPEFGEIAARWGPFDLVILPVGAYEPRWFMRTMHMNPEDALEAYRALRGAQSASPPPKMLPIHWGTFRLTDEDLLEPPERTRAAWIAHGWPAEDLWLLAHGETRVLIADR